MWHTDSALAVQIPVGVTPGGYVPVIVHVGTVQTADTVWIAVSGN